MVIINIKMVIRYISCVMSLKAKSLKGPSTIYITYIYSCQTFSPAFKYELNWYEYHMALSK